MELNIKNFKVLNKKELKDINGGALMCYNEIGYDDGYWYVANQGSDIDTCKGIVGTSYTDSFGTFTVKNCFCTSYAK